MSRWGGGEELFFDEHVPREEVWDNMDNYLGYLAISSPMKRAWRTNSPACHPGWTKRRHSNLS
jgi:hypothetical protein